MNINLPSGQGVRESFGSLAKADKLMEEYNNMDDEYQQSKVPTTGTTIKPYTGPTELYTNHRLIAGNQQQPSHSTILPTASIEGFDRGWSADWAIGLQKVGPRRPNPDILPQQPNPENVYEGIPQEALDELIEIFFACVYHIEPMSFLHPAIFLRNLKYRADCPILLNAMYAVAARFSKHPAIITKSYQMLSQCEEQTQNNPALKLHKEARYVAGEEFYMRARSNVMQVVESHRSLSACQALIFLAFYSFASGRASAGRQVRHLQFLASRVAGSVSDTDLQQS